MRELTIEVPDELFGPVKKLLQNLRGTRLTGTRKLADVVPVPPAFTPEQQLFVDELKQSLRDAEAFERGELHLPTWNEVRTQQRADEQRAAQPRPAA